MTKSSRVDTPPLPPPTPSATLRAMSQQSRPASDFGALLRPRSVAIVGASANPDSPGHDYLRSLIDFGFEGDVYPVHPRESELTTVPRSAEAPPRSYGGRLLSSPAMNWRMSATSMLLLSPSRFTSPFSSQASDGNSPAPN